MRDMKNPPCAGTTGFQKTVQLGGKERLKPTPENLRDQWDKARRLERSSIVQARTALLLRGAERFHALALASAYALAARTAAYSAGEFQQ